MRGQPEVCLRSKGPTGRAARDLSLVPRLSVAGNTLRSTDELADIARQIKNAGDVHPAQLSQQVIAVGRNADGVLVAATNTSSSFTRRQRALMEQLGTGVRELTDASRRSSRASTALVIESASAYSSDGSAVTASDSRVESQESRPPSVAPGSNEVVVLELDRPGSTVELRDQPDLGLPA